MKKILLLSLLAVMIFAAGCGKKSASLPQTPPTTEEINTEATIEATADTEVIDFVTENTFAEDSDSPTENTIQETEPSEPAASETGDRWNDYIVTVQEQSDTIKTSLESDATLKQHDLNTLSQELYTLWDDALNDLWAELKSRLPEDEFSVLLDQQLVWIEEKEQAVEEAGKEFENGSIYQLIVNQTAAEITEARVYELYELLKQSEM